MEWLLGIIVALVKRYVYLQSQGMDALGASQTGDKGMNINAAGISLIEQFEGCKLTAYQDVVGIWTIGYGHTGHDVYPGLTITQQEAHNLLLADLDKFDLQVKQLLKISLNDNQFSALVSFAYNLGTASLKRSTLLSKVNAGDFKDAANEFMKWVYAGGKEEPGLVARRTAEKELFLS